MAVYPDDIFVETVLGAEAFDWRAFDPDVFDSMTPLVRAGSGDVISQYGLRLKYGINGNGPTDRIASTGELRFSLRNDPANSGSARGYYSPVHASKRTGWGFGNWLRVGFTYSGTTYTKFLGKVRDIMPAPGIAREQKVDVIAYDIIRDLAEASARETTVQINADEDALITALLDVVPEDSQPYARDLDDGVDTFPIAFDNVSDAKVLSVIADIVRSSYGLFFIKGNGLARFVSRHNLAITTSAFTLNDTMHGLSVPSSLAGVFKRVRVTTHPKTVSAAATEELYTLPSGTSIEIQAGDTRDVWTEYSDPNDRQSRVGGTAVVTALVGGTHYTANSAADGSGTNLTSSITATLTPFAGTAKWTLTNASTSAAFMTQLKVIGKAIRDPGPLSFESVDSAATIDRPIHIDMPYQDDNAVGQSAADYIRIQYGSLTQQVNQVEFIANASSSLMTQALTREPGDVITITETMTGLSSVTALILSVELEVLPGKIVMCRWGLAPASTLRAWQWGIVGASEWGSTTVYAF